MSSQAKASALVLSGASLRAAVLAAENPLLKSILRSRFFQQMHLSEVLDLDLRTIDEQVRPASLPVLIPIADEVER